MENQRSALARQSYQSKTTDAYSSNASLQRRTPQTDQYVRPDKCCGLYNKGRFYKVATIILIVFDVVLVVLALIVVFVFSLNTNISHFQPDWAAKYDGTAMNDVENHYVALMLPNIVILFFKTSAGIRWIFKKFSRPSYQTYYLLSWSFYTSFFVQETFILMASWNVFNDEIRNGSLFAVFASLVLFIFLRLHMKHIDNQNFEINKIRKQAKQAKQRNLTLTQIARQQSLSYKLQQSQQNQLLFSQNSTRGDVSSCMPQTETSIATAQNSAGAADAPNLGNNELIRQSTTNPKPSQAPLIKTGVSTQHSRVKSMQDAEPLTSLQTQSVDNGSVMSPKSGQGLVMTNPLQKSQRERRVSHEIDQFNRMMSKDMNEHKLDLSGMSDLTESMIN